LKDLDEDFVDLLLTEECFPPTLPDIKTLYTDFYNDMMDLTVNIVCASCSCIDHHPTNFEKVSVDDASLRLLKVDPSLVPFDYKSSISILNSLNIIFFSDFLQLPAVRNPDLYVYTKEWEQGYRLWQSLNAVVILKEQIRQAGDPFYASILSRIRIRVPTDDDIRILKSQIGARLPNMRSVPTVVQRHILRQAMNIRRLQEAESTSDTHVTYCVAHTSKLKNMSLH
jgi:hypothetical protein